MISRSCQEAWRGAFCTELNRDPSRPGVGYTVPMTVDGRAWEGSRVAGLDLLLEKARPNQNLSTLPLEAQAPRSPGTWLASKQVRAILPLAVALIGGNHRSKRRGCASPTTSLCWAVPGAVGMVPSSPEGGLHQCVQRPGRTKDNVGSRSPVSPVPSLSSQPTWLPRAARYHLGSHPSTSPTTQKSLRLKQMWMLLSPRLYEQ